MAGGELLIPTIVLLFGQDIETVGSLFLLISLPTRLVAFARDSRDGSFPNEAGADSHANLLVGGGDGWA